MEPVLKRGKWCVNIKGRNFKFNTREEAMEKIGGDALVEEILEELEPDQREFNWKPWLQET